MDIAISTEIGKSLGMEELRARKSTRGSRRAGSGLDNVDKQRERKRTMDRIAQKMSREKTKARIAQLENMVAILEAKNESNATNKLLAELDRQSQEIDRLRKIIASITSILRNEVFEHIPTGGFHDHSSPSSDETQGNAAAESAQHCQHYPLFVDTTLPAGEMEQGLTNEAAENYLNVQNECPLITDKTDLRMPRDLLNSTTQNRCIDKIVFGSSWQREHIATSRNENVNLAPSHFLDAWNPIPPPISRPVPRDALSMTCKVWQRSNNIYAKMFDITPANALNARNSHASSLFKAVKNGWASLNTEEQNNPALQILKQVDQEIFPELDPVTRIANLYKSHLLLKYYLNAEAHNWGTMPAWQRPLPAQNAKQHPIAVDFFAWPALRERLIHEHYKYFATSEFSDLYRKNLRFSWPFSFEDTYRYCEVTDTYHASPLFDRYHRDLKYWGVKEVLFQHFPELRDAISMPLEHLNDESLLLSGVQLPHVLPFGRNDMCNESANRVRTPPSGFSYDYMMELFCDLPRVA